jgi:hypothetical protein
VKPADLPVLGPDRDKLVTPTVIANSIADPPACPVFTWGEMSRVVPDGRQWYRKPDPAPSIYYAVVSAAHRLEQGAAAEDVMAEVLAPRKGRAFHDGVAAYVRHAVRTYAEISERRRNIHESPMHVTGDRELVRTSAQDAQWTMRTGGILYDTDDGRVREVRRLRYGAPRPTSPAGDVWALLAAKAALEGCRDGHAMPDAPPERVVVIEVGLDTGTEELLLEVTPAELAARYAAVAQPTVVDAASGATYRPGRDCGRCRFAGVCPALPKTNGVLGLPGRNLFTRAVSASDLDRYFRCPTSYHLSSQFVPRERGSTAAQNRGRAVHRWLRTAHARGIGACAEADLPPPDDNTHGLADGLLSNREYHVAWPYLRQHVQVCPLGDDIENLDVEPTRYTYDGHADVVVAASPDITFDTGDGPVWWETKSTDLEFPADARAALETYTSVALDLVLLAELTTATVGRPLGLVRLELLRRDAVNVIPLDASDGTLVASAVRIVAEAAYGWSSDGVFTPRVTRACRWCDVRRWCEHRDGNNEPPPAGRDTDILREPDGDDPF